VVNMTYLVITAVLLLQHPAGAVPHGDHTPKHGGIFFMAPDVFHHLEGVIEGGEFRLYIYDNFTEPLDVRKFQAVVNGRAMLAAEDGAYLRTPFAKPAGADPPELTAFVSFAPGGREERFDFIFLPPPPPDVLPDFVIPETADAIFREILLRDSRIRALIARGAWTELFTPALEAKDLALALDSRASEAGVTLALKKIVRAAWLLDAYGDLGNREKVLPAYQLFEAGVAELKRVYER
jgi:hypothetical protein